MKHRLGQALVRRLLTGSGRLSLKTRNPPWITGWVCLFLWLPLVVQRVRQLSIVQR